MGGVNWVGLNVEIAVAGLAEGDLTGWPRGCRCARHGTLAFVHAPFGLLFRVAQLHEAAHRVAVIGAVVAIEARLVVHFGIAGHPVGVVEAHQGVGIVAQLLAQCAGGFPVAGFAFRALVGGVHGPFGAEAEGRRNGPQADEHGGHDQGDVDHFGPGASGWAEDGRRIACGLADAGQDLFSGRAGFGRQDGSGFHRGPTGAADPDFTGMGEASPSDKAEASRLSPVCCFTSRAGRHRVSEKGGGPALARAHVEAVFLGLDDVFGNVQIAERAQGGFNEPGGTTDVAGVGLVLGTDGLVDVAVKDLPSLMNPSAWRARNEAPYMALSAFRLAKMTVGTCRACINRSSRLRTGVMPLPAVTKCGGAGLR